MKQPATYFAWGALAGAKLYGATTRYALVNLAKVHDLSTEAVLPTGLVWHFWSTMQESLLAGTGEGT